jgi:hypothetical protein
LKGNKKWMFSITFFSDNKTFKGVEEDELRRLFDSGDFNEKGRIRMVPYGLNLTGGAGALRPVSYKGEKRPI